MMHAIGTIIVALIGGAVGQADVSAGATPDQIAQAIEQLGAPQFEARQAAAEQLWRTGEAAAAALAHAAKSSDPEVRTRAADLLNKLRLGIRPDSAPELLALIDQFRYAPNNSQRQEALRQLQAKGNWSTIVALIRGEHDPQERRNLATAMAGETSKLIAPLIARGDLDQIEEILELVASSEVGLPQLTAFLLVTDRLDRRIEQARQRAEDQPTDANWTRLAYLLRAKGDSAAAIAAADKTSDLILRSNLNAEAGRWLTAATLAEQIFRQNTNRIEAAAFATTFYRLAGREIDHQRTLETLLKAANVDRLKDNAAPLKADDPFAPGANLAVRNLVTAAKTLLVNERIDEAQQIMRKINPPFAHRMYWRRHRHREALEFVGVTLEKALDQRWFNQLPIPPPLLTVNAEDRVVIAGQVARELRELGRKEQVDQIWRLLEGLDVQPAQRANRSAALASLAWQLGRRDDAIRHAADAIEVSRSIAGTIPNRTAAAILGDLADREGPLAFAWYERALAESPPLQEQEAISRALGMVVPDRRGGKPPENWRQIVAAARASVQELQPRAKAERLVAFGQTCEIRGDKKFAGELFTEAAETDPASGMHIGNLAAAAGDWKVAVEHYAAAYQAKPDDHQLGMLLANALSKSGDQEAGDEQFHATNLALLVPETRRELVSIIREPRLKQEAVRQYEIVCRTALPDSQSATRAAQTIGNIVSADQPRRSALCWQQMLLHVLNPSSDFTEPEAYPALSHVIHSTLARAALAEGQRDIVAAERAQCDKLLPADINSVLKLVPRLRSGGMSEMADQVLDRALAVHRQIISEFPTSATYRNDAAWMAARCQRKLDEALAWAEKAASLAPDEPSYHDTLAEVHFQRGDREAAVAAAQKAVDLSPQNTFFAERLKHFQDDELKSLDGLDAE